MNGNETRRSRRACAVFTLAVLISSVAPASAQQAAAGPWRQYATPEEAGFNATKLEAVRRHADSVRSGAVMAVYRGRVLVAWGDVARELELHSVRKSLVSALYGTAIAENRIDLGRTLADIGIQDRDPLTDAERQARIRDLLAARSGVYLPAAYAASDQDESRPARGSHAPGTHFFYNNWDFNVAGVIYERLAGEKLYESFARRIARPIGAEDFGPEDGFPVYEPSSSIHPAHTFRMSTRDLARFGQLFLQRGRWAGRQIVPADWVALSTRPVSDFGDGSGYAFMWWTRAAGSTGARYPQLSRYGNYSAQGTGGQLVLVVPDAELVIVHRGDTDQNRNVAGRDAWAIAEGILVAREGEPAAEPRLVPLQPTPLASQAPPRPALKPLALDRALLAEYAGDYEIAPNVVARAFIWLDRLFMNFPGQGEAELLAVTPAEFTIMPVAGVRVTFVRDANGRVSEFNASLGPQRFHGRKR